MAEKNSVLESLCADNGNCDATRRMRQAGDTPSCGDSALNSSGYCRAVKRIGGLFYRSPAVRASSQQLVATITPAQMRDVRLLTPWYDVGIASLE